MLMNNFILQLKEKQEKNRKEEDRKRAEYKAGRHVGVSVLFY